MNPYHPRYIHKANLKPDHVAGRPEAGGTHADSLQSRVEYSTVQYSRGHVPCTIIKMAWGWRSWCGTPTLQCNTRIHLYLYLYGTSLLIPHSSLFNSIPNPTPFFIFSFLSLIGGELSVVFAVDLSMPLPIGLSN